MCPTKITEPKLKAMLLYFAAYTDPRLLGKVKLMKLFYFSDFVHVKRYISPITFDNYVHLEHGPVPSTILNLINAVENDIDNAMLSDTISVDIRKNSNQKRIVPLRKFTEKDAEYFTPSELKVMQEICKRFSAKTGKYLEDASHKEAAFTMTRELEGISYSLAVHDPDCSEDVKKDEIELIQRIF